MKKGRQDRIAETLTNGEECEGMNISIFCVSFHHKYLVYNYSANGETDEPLFKTIRELHKFDINKCNRRYCNGDFVNEKQHNIQWVEVLSKEALQD